MKEKNAVGLAMGILSIPCGMLFPLSGIILGILGIVSNASTRTKGGLVCSIIGLVLSVIAAIIYIKCGIKNF